MSDYRIDIRGAIALPGMKEGKPRAEACVVVSIQLTRYGSNAKELKPELLWGPVIFDGIESYGKLFEEVGPYFDEVVRRHKAGKPTGADVIKLPT